MENRLLGLPRMRQIKVHNSSCDVPESFGGIIKRCFNRYSPEREDKESFPPDFPKHTSLNAWQYKTHEELNSSSMSHKGKAGTYPGNGFTQTLSTTKKQSQLMMAELKENLWVGPGTRIIFIDFTVYNANLNMFCVVKQIFEFPATGGILADASYTALKLIRYTTVEDYVVMASELILFVFLVFYIIEEIVEISVLKKGYFKGFFNNIDYIVILMCLAILGHRAFTYFIIQPSLKDINISSSEFIDFTCLAFWSYFFDSLTGCCSFLAWVKIFKYISFNKAMTQLSGTLSRCRGDMIGFMVMFCIIFTAFVQLGYLLFGAQVEDYSSMYNAMFALIRTILGDFDFITLEAANRFFGPVYFLCFVFFVFFVLLNMFLAILSDSFGEVKAEIAAKKNEFEMGDYFKQGYINIIDKIGQRTKQMDIEEAIKRAEDEGYTNMNDIRAYLKKYVKSSM